MNDILGQFIEFASKNQWCPTIPPSNFNLVESDWPYLQIDFEDNFEKMHQE